MDSDQLHRGPVTTHPIRNVVFDVGGVIVDWNPQRVLTQLYDDPELRRHVAAALFEGGGWSDFDRGTLSEADLLTGLAARSGRSPVEMRELFVALRDSLVPKPETLRLIDTLHDRGIPLYCLSNMADSIYQHLAARHDFWTRFKGIVISGQVQLLKPERAIYDYLVARHGLIAAETVFLDDLEENVIGARAAGLQSLQFRDAADAEHQLRGVIS